jgi:hypothetical protein
MLDKQFFHNLMFCWYYYVNLMFDTRELCDHSHIGRGNSCTYGRDKFSYTVLDFKTLSSIR